MELREFIKTSIVDICLAIDDSNKELSEQSSDAVVSPGSIQINSDGSQAYGRESNKSFHGDNRVVHKIDFDVAVSAEEGKKTDGGVKISIASIGLGANGESKSNNSSVSRLSFSVPIIFPEVKRFNREG